MTASSPVVNKPSGDGFRAGAWAGALAALAIIVLFLPTARDMAGIWWRSETFAHGMVVVPISLWLLWGLRHRLSALPLRPAPAALGVLLLAALAWVFGETAGVAALSHGALAAMVIAAIWAVWGHVLAREAMFPLGFLFFCVPVGEFLVPTLMHYTADFAVSAVRASGVPVYREGLSFVIPSGRWSVVEACSGIRYLIASLMVGFLFAYLNYRSFVRRALFVVASIVVPLIANWLRAYMIVMIGHLSGNKLATGVDHLIYGWIFFGIVILGLFWVGALWREAEAPMPQAAAQLAAENANRGVWRRVLPMLLAVCVVTGVWVPLQHWLLAIPPARAYALTPPPAAPGWLAVAGEPAAAWVPHYVGERARLVQSYQQGSETVTLFVAYYARQTPGHKLVQWDNRLLFAEDKVWMQLVDTPDTLAGAVATRHAELKSEGARLAVWSWLWLGDSRTSDPHRAKLDLVMRRLGRRPDDCAAVIVYTPQGDDPVAARRRVDAFVAAHLSGIEAALAAAPRN